MKVLIAHDERLHLGGAETLLRELTAALRLQGCEVAWATERVPDVARMFKPEFVLVITPAVKLGLGVLEWVQARYPDQHALVLVDYWPACHQRNLAHLGRNAICRQCAGDCPTGRAHPWVTEIVNRSLVLALNAGQMEINRRLGIRTDAWIGCGLDTNFWHPAEDWQIGEPRVLSSTAWGMAQYGNVWWKGEPFLRKLEEDLHITIHGITGVPRWAVRDVLQQGHVYVFPSIWDESWGYCLTEAMACGLACVAFDQAGARAQIEHGVNGILVRRGDYEALRAAVVRLRGNQEERERLGRNARHQAVAQFGLQRMGAAYLAFMQDVGTQAA